LVTDTCASAGLADLADTAALLTSELVTNAVLHARRPPSLGVAVSDGQLVVDVGDPDPRHPQLDWAGAYGEHGRGLAIVDALADDWGVRQTPDGGKSVWFALHT
jgi:anti-sigma regulatory factor (Ser/Thr protein kinase)